MVLRNIRLTIAYEGTNYCGWQKQPQLATIQGTLESALNRVTGEGIAVIGAGRTDANFQTRSRIPTDRFPTVLNNVLPPDIIIRDAVRVDPAFHSQYGAKAKTYKYRIDNSRWPHLFWRRFAYHYWGDLDLGAMAKTASVLEGAHDFRAFCAAGTQVKTFVRTVKNCSVIREGHLIVISITADGFLYNMVRIIAGTLLEVAKGRINPDDVRTIVTSGRRELAGPTLPPYGLCLEEVQYGGETPAGP